MCGYPSCTKAIGRLVAIEFDTWNNLNLHDPKQGVSRWWINATDFVGYNDNHVAIFATGHAHGTSNNHASPNHFAATPSIPNLADGRIHEVKIKYWPQKNGKHLRTLKKPRGVPHETAIGLHGDCQDQTTGTDSLNRRPAPDHCVPGTFSATKPGNLAVFIDDMKRPVLQTKITLRKGDSSEHCTDPDTDRFVLDTLGNGYLGFSAATGGERTGVQIDESGITTTFDYNRGGKLLCQPLIDHFIDVSADFMFCLQIMVMALEITLDSNMPMRLSSSRLVLLRGMRLSRGFSATRLDVSQFEHSPHQYDMYHIQSIKKLKTAQDSKTALKSSRQHQIFSFF